MEQDQDNVVYLSRHSATGTHDQKAAPEVHEVQMNVVDVDDPADEVFVDDDRVIIRTPDGGGMAITPLAAKELAVRLIEAACHVERG